MGGGAGHLAVMADCERALGQPEKAIELSRSVEAADLDESGAAELRIVVAGARADLGQLEAAIGYLEAAGVKTEAGKPYSARLQYAYGDLLAKAGRSAEALDAFMKAADLDEDEETDALDRIDEFLEVDAPVEDAEQPTPAGENDEPAVEEDAEPAEVDAEPSAEADAEPVAEMDAEPVAEADAESVTEDEPATDAADEAGEAEPTAGRLFSDGPTDR